MSRSFKVNKVTVNENGGKMLNTLKIQEHAKKKKIS